MMNASTRKDAPAAETSIEIDEMRRRIARLERENETLKRVGGRMIGEAIDAGITEGFVAAQEEKQKAPLAPLSFVDCHGATVNISPGHARNYARIKSDQLKVLTYLLSEDEIGELGLDRKDLDTFQLMAFEYAVAVNALIGIVADDVANSAKGGV